MQPTDPNKFTEKAWQAVVRTPDLAKQGQQQQIESEHLMQSLLEQEGLASAIFTKAGVNLQQLRDKTAAFIARQPKVSNASSGSVYLGRSLDSLLDRAEKYRQQFEDEYISIEHLVLGFVKDDRFGKEKEGHIRSPIRAVYCEEPQSRSIYTEQARIHMGHQLVRFLGRCI